MVKKHDIYSRRSRNWRIKSILETIIFFIYMIVLFATVYSVYGTFNVVSVRVPDSTSTAYHIIFNISYYFFLLVFGFPGAIMCASNYD